jgi:hypothetical protein
MSQSSGADGFVPVGYRSCRGCGEFMLVTQRASYCVTCRDEMATEARALELATLDRRPLVTRPTKARRRKARPTEARRLWNRARSRAMQRLVRIHRPMYEVLLAEEKAALGLDPHLDERHPGDGAIAAEFRRVG